MLDLTEISGRRQGWEPLAERLAGVNSWDSGALNSSDAATCGVKILNYTFGRFSVCVSGLPIRTDGKAKQRPLALLKAIIALGGRDIAANQLWECLWPDSDGDLGARNLAVTLHRLRELLGASAAVRLHDGKLTLNDRICWVDIWSFERWVNEGIARVDAHPEDEDGLALLHRAFALYRGHFLSCETEEHWMLAPRLKLKAKFERLVSALLDRLERQKRYAEAAGICLMALERDPLNELLYRRLMRCHLSVYEFSSVMRTYRQCLEALHKGFGVQPSGETQRIYLDAVRAAVRSDEVPVPMPRLPHLPRLPIRELR